MELSTRAATPEEKKPTWWQRNWKWFVPVAGVGFLAFCAVFVMLMVFMTFGRIKTSEVYKDALAQARNNPAVVKALGSPIEAGRVVSGSIIKRGPLGQAELAIPISGPRGKGTIYCRATKKAGRWTFSRLIVEIEATKERIEIIGPAEQEKLLI